jgi:hypothetical protein
VTFETRLHPDSPFGVVTSRMLFEVSGGDAPYTIDATARLSDAGTGQRVRSPHTGEPSRRRRDPHDAQA